MIHFFSSASRQETPVSQRKTLVCRLQTTYHRIDQQLYSCHMVGEAGGGNTAAIRLLNSYRLVPDYFIINTFDEYGTSIFYYIVLAPKPQKHTSLLVKAQNSPRLRMVQVRLGQRSSG